MRLLVVLLALSACRHPAPAGPHIDQIEVRVRLLGPATLPVPDQLELDKLVEEAVASVPGPIHYDPKSGASTRLLVTVEIGSQPGSLRSTSRAQLEPRGDDLGTTRIEREAVVEKERMKHAPTPDEVRDHLRRAFKLTAAAAVAAEDLWLGPPEAIRAALSSKDSDLALDAVGFVGERHDREAVPALITLLKSDSPELRDRSIGALAELGDPRAVHPLADLAKFGDLEQLPKIIDAVSRIGGDEATAYLEFVVAGHPSPEIHDLATRALEHLKSRGH